MWWNKFLLVAAFLLCAASASAQTHQPAPPLFACPALHDGHPLFRVDMRMKMEGLDEGEVEPDEAHGSYENGRRVYFLGALQDKGAIFSLSCGYGDEETYWKNKAALTVIVPINRRVDRCTVLGHGKKNPIEVSCR